MLRVPQARDQEGAETTLLHATNLSRHGLKRETLNHHSVQKNKIFKINHHCKILCRDIKYTLLIQNSRLDAYKLLKIYRIKTG